MFHSKLLGLNIKNYIQDFLEKKISPLEII